MNYYYIEYYYESEVDITIYRKYSSTAFVRADTFELACEKIKKMPKHQNDRNFYFFDLTIQ